MTKEWTDLSLEEMVNELEQMGTETTPPEVDESQYPLSYKEFEKKFTNKLVSDCVKQYKLTKKEILTDLKEYLDENPTTIEDDYIDCCEYYDLCKKYYGKEKRAEGEAIVSPQIAFNARLNLNVHQVGTELYFF